MNTIVRTPVEYTSSALEASASNLLTLQVLMKDFKAVKDSMPKSWQASSNGKIYWCAELTGHKLSIQDGKLLVDGKTADSMLEKLLEPEKE